MTDDHVPQVPFRDRADTALDRRRRAAIGEAIVEGYRRIPQEGENLSWSDRATAAAMIAEEPW